MSTDSRILAARSSGKTVRNCSTALMPPEPPYPTNATGLYAHSVKCQSIAFFTDEGKLWLYSGTRKTNPSASASRPATGDAAAPAGCSSCIGSETVARSIMSRSSQSIAVRSRSSHAARGSASLGLRTLPITTAIRSRLSKLSSAMAPTLRVRL